MTYTELTFFLALVPVVLVAWVVPTRFKASWLLLASYAFYATWSLQYLILLVVVTVFVYEAARVIGEVADEARRKRALVCSNVAILSVLILFKYPDVLALMLRPGNSQHFLANILAPLGISYYLFKSISYLMDVYWDTIPAERDPIRVALYISFFPQILSGPIQRAPEFFEQIRSEDFCRAHAAHFEAAVGLLILGFFEKLVLADRIGPLVSVLDAQPHASASMALVADYSYAFQLFTDFSGLTHIALGLGLLFGIEGPPNFNRPFAAANIQEYWRRWHMSLTSWLTDYLFTPLRMSLRTWGNLGLCVSLMINMILIGIWHGSNPTYLVFGVIHGLFLISSSLTLATRNRFFKTRRLASFVRKIYAPIVTFHMVVFALIFFRSPSIAFALGNIKTIIGQHAGDAVTWDMIGRDIWMGALAASFIGFALATGFFGLLRLGVSASPPRRSFVRWSFYSVCALLTVMLTTVTGGQFMYARF